MKKSSDLFNFWLLAGLILPVIVVMAAWLALPASEGSVVEGWSDATTTPIVVPAAEIIAAAPSPFPTPLPVMTEPTPTPIPTLPSPIRAVGVSYAHISTSRDDVPTLQAQMAAAGVNWVGLTAGRPDWAYFRWTPYPEYWSSAVRTNAIDYLAEDSAAFAFGHVNAIVDVYAPNYILAHPDAAAISFWGEASPLLVSTAALTSGPFHDLLLDMLTFIAANYPVDSISLTELSYRIYGYGPDDLALYQAYSGRADWPRNRQGAIEVDHPSIGEWRSQALAGFLAAAADRVRPHGVQLYFDVSVSWGNLDNEGREYGHHYATLLQVVDGLIVWGYTDLAGYPPNYAGEIAAYLATHYPEERIIISVGLWGQEGDIMSPESLAAAVTSISNTALPDTWITPTSLMTTAHWQALAAAWNR